jgi:glucokinase
MSADQYAIARQTNRSHVHPDAHQPRACIGAGTGLGTVYIAPAQGDVLPGIVMPSEGGHTIVAVPLSDQDMDVLACMYEILGTRRVSYEDVLAGRGLTNVYQALQSLGVYSSTQVTRQIAQEGLRPDHITMYAEHDPLCREALSWYQRWYGQYAQTVALTGLTSGGLYITGGIIAHNPDLPASLMFQEAFLQHPRHSDFLSTVPVVVVRDYDISLYGAAWYYSQRVLA